MGKAAKNPISWEISVPGTENQGIKYKIFIQETQHASDGDGKCRSQEVFAQLGHMFKKRHFAAFAVMALVFVLLI